MEHGWSPGAVVDAMTGLSALLGLLLVLALVYAGWLYLRQGSIIFQPSRDLRGSPTDVRLRFETLRLRCPDGVEVHGWWVAGRTSKVVLVFHGRTGNVAHELPTMQFWHALGAHVLAVDYPGYGRSGGHPSEEGCYRAAETAWSYLRSVRGVEPADIIIFGRSLGSAVGVQLAAGRSCGGLVFHSGFTSLRDAAARMYPYLPVRWFCRTKMDSLERIAHCHCPFLMLHAERDEVNPLAQTMRVYERAPGPKKLVVMAGDHAASGWLRERGVETACAELLSGDLRGWEAAPLTGRDDTGQRLANASAREATRRRAGVEGVEVDNKHVAAGEAEVGGA